MTTITHLFTIAYIVCWLYILREAFFVFLSSVKCRKIRGCKKDNCPLRRHCFYARPSDKERALIQEKIDSLK